MARFNRRQKAAALLGRSDGGYFDGESFMRALYRPRGLRPSKTFIGSCFLEVNGKAPI